MSRRLTADLALVRAERDDQARGRREAEAKLAEVQAEIERWKIRLEISVAGESWYERAVKAEAEVERSHKAILALTAEVERLTAERDRQRGAAEKYYAESERLRAEIERLKEGTVPKEEHSRHPTGDYCIFCRAQWPCEESEIERLREVIAGHQAWVDSDPDQWVMRKDTALRGEPRLSTEGSHPFEPCREGDEGDDPAHNFTCALLCVVCGLPSHKHTSRLSTEEETLAVMVAGQPLVKLREIESRKDVRL